MSLKHRIQRLEQVIEPPAAPVYGVRVGGGPVKVGDEEMTLPEFEARYPHGRLCDIHIVNQRPDESSTSPY